MPLDWPISLAEIVRQRQYDIDQLLAVAKSLNLSNPHKRGREIFKITIKMYIRVLNINYICTVLTQVYKNIHTTVNQWCNKWSMPSWQRRAATIVRMRGAATSQGLLVISLTKAQLNEIIMFVVFRQSCWK